MSFSYSIYVDTPLSEPDLLKYVAVASQIPHKLSEWQPSIRGRVIYTLAQELCCFLVQSCKPAHSMTKQLAELFDINPTVELYFQINRTHFYTAECEEIWSDILKCLLVEITGDVVIIFNGEKVRLVKSSGKVKAESDFRLWEAETQLDIIVSYEQLPTL